MSFADTTIDALRRPLDRGHVKEREQGGRSLSYIESWHAIAEANRIFGFDGWDSETVDIKCVAEHERKIGRAPNQKDGWGVSYTAKVRVTVCGVVREGVGAGHGIDVDLGLAHESAIKEAESDARKRGLMTFGNPFGLALYDKSQANVADAPPPPSIAFESHKQAIEQAADMETLRLAFDAAKADKSLLKEEGEALILAKELRKRQLTPAPKTLGEHLDNIEQEQAA